MKRKIINCIVILLLLTLIFFIRKSQTVIKPSVFVNGHQLTIEKADTEEKRIRGLSGRAKLGENEGMLFIFPQKSVQSFWMKDMRFPLDIIWIAGDSIVGISANLLPEGSNPKNIYSSQKLIDKVLEVNGGIAQKYGIKVGDEIQIANGIGRW